MCVCATKKRPCQMVLYYLFVSDPNIGVFGSSRVVPYRPEAGKNVQQYVMPSSDLFFFSLTFFSFHAQNAVVVFFSLVILTVSSTEYASHTYSVTNALQCIQNATLERLVI